MNIDLYSDRAKQAVQSAQSLALARRHQQLAPEHLLKVLLEEKDGLTRALIQSAGGRPDEADRAERTVRMQEQGTGLDLFAATIVPDTEHRGFVAALPGQAIPDRRDFVHIDDTTRERFWRAAVDRSRYLADAFAAWCADPEPARWLQPL